MTFHFVIYNAMKTFWGYYSFSADFGKSQH